MVPQWPPQPVQCYTLSLSLSLSLLQPLDRLYLALSRIHTLVGCLNSLVLNRLGGSTVR